MNVCCAWTYAICCVYDNMFMGKSYWKIIFVVANYTYKYYIHFFECLSILILLKFELQFCIYLYFLHLSAPLFKLISNSRILS